MKTVIGIDPGKQGALAAMREDGTLTFIPMPVAGKDIDAGHVAAWIISLWTDKECKPLSVCIEKVHAMPGNGATSMFTFGYNVGLMHGVVAALNIPLLLVSPQAWKKEVLVDTLKDKNAAIDFVRRYYPKADITLTPRSKKAHSGIADAICIARFGLSKQ